MVKNIKPGVIKNTAPKQTKKSISALALKFSSMMSKCWLATKKHVAENSFEYIYLTFLVVCGTVGSYGAYKIGKARENAMNYIEQNDYNRYIDMCIKETRERESLS